MKRLSSLALVAALLATAAGAAADRPAGTWRMTVDLGAGQSVTVLLSLDSQNGQWTGKCLGATADLGKENTLDNVRVAADRLRFTVIVDGQALMSFDGRMAVQGPIRGSVILGNNLLLTSLEPSKLTKFDRFELLKEVIAGAESAPVLFENTADMLQLAGANKATLDEVRAWTEKAVKAAEPYGVRYQQSVAVRIAETLADQPEYATVALAQAQRAERLLEPTDDIALQAPILETLAKLLRHANKPADAKEVAARIGKLEEREYLEYVKKSPLSFKPDVFAGRKLKSDRAVLMELFTGSECPPCIAADIAFDALGTAYKPSEVVRLQYHLHIPGPDPLTNPATEARSQYYAAATQGTPASIFNGKEQAGGGGRSPEEAKSKFQQYKKVIDPILETPARAKVQVAAQRDGDKIAVNAKVSELAKPGDKVRLRLLLAEEVVRYQGGNGIRYHHHVVRAFAGSPEGFPLKLAASDHQAVVNIEEVRGALSTYLDKFQKEAGVSFPGRPLGLHKFVVVAIVQDDATQEVLQVAQVEVKN